MAIAPRSGDFLWLSTGLIVIKGYPWYGRVVMARNVRLTGDQRGRIAEKVMEWGNLMFAGLVIGQYASGVPVNSNLTILGILGMLLAYFIAITFMRSADRQYVKRIRT